MLFHLNQSIKFCANACLGSLLLIASAIQAAPNDDAGEVTFLLGKAFLNEKTPVKIGTKIGSGDTIQTLENGHVHVRFIDDGLLSVRPDSRLSIEHYQYNAQQPDQSVIKFNLEQGVMRSISGQGAKSARDKFRLNTPIAAIGVRGTDFVVKSSDNLLQAVVNEGAIIVSPYSVDCQAAALGPCQSSNVVELASDAQQILEFSSMYDAPRLLPLSAGIPNVSIDEAQIESKSYSSETTDKTNASEKSTEATENSDATETVDKSGLDNRLVNEVTADTFISSQPSTIESARLVWGRFSGIQPTDKIVYNIETASDGRDRVSMPSPSISNLALFRSPSERNQIDSSLGDVAFNLLSSQATVNNNGVLSAASVSSSSHLNINFSTGSFNTEVLVSASNLSPVSISGSGRINDEGFFNYTSADTAIHGASSLDGDVSSFMFYKDVGAGTSIEGVTNWYSK